MDAEKLAQMPVTRLGTGRYDRIRPLVEGRVATPPVAWSPMAVQHIPGAFARGEIDVAEISFGELLLLRAAGESVRALPVFVSQGVRHDTLYVRADSALQTGQDLAGARIGATLLHGTTVIWLRDALIRQYGLGLDAVTWHIGPMDRAAAQAKPIPEGSPLRAVAIPPGDTQEAMLMRGDLDAILSYRVPDLVASGQMRPLLSDPLGEARTYLAGGGAIPLLHVLALREDFAAAHPLRLEALFRALVAARDVALADLHETAVFTTSLPHLSMVMEQAERAFPCGLWPYGLDGAQDGIRVFLEAAVQQGLIKASLTAEKIFFPFEELSAGETAGTLT